MVPKKQDLIPSNLREELVLMMELLYQLFEIYNAKQVGDDKLETIMDYIGKMEAIINKVKKYYEDVL